MGHGPGLPATGVVAAVMRDRISATLRNGAAAFRAHPLLLLPPLIIVISGTLVYILTAAVTITFRAPPQASGPYPSFGGAPGVHRSQSPGSAGAPVVGGGPTAGPDPTASGPDPGRSTRPPGRGHSPSPSPSGSASATSGPSPAPSGTGSPAPGPSLTPTPSPTPSPSPSCLQIGPLGICLKL